MVFEGTSYGVYPDNALSPKDVERDGGLDRG
jgi:hypothetical protein